MNGVKTPNPDDEDKAAEELKNDLSKDTPDDEQLDAYAYLARLSCGCEVKGTTRASHVRVGSHGQWCDVHEQFSLFEDFISAGPLV